MHTGVPRRASNLASVHLLGRKKHNSGASSATPEDVQTSPERAGTTAPKGKPTPSAKAPAPAPLLPKGALFSVGSPAAGFGMFRWFATTGLVPSS